MALGRRQGGIEATHTTTNRKQPTTSKAATTFIAINRGLDEIINN
jgi:hypothetical protein